MTFAITRTLVGLIAAVALAGCPGRDREDEPRGAASVARGNPDRPDLTIGGTIIPQSHEFPVARAADIRRLFENNVVSYPVSVVSSAGTQTQFVNPRPVFIGDHRFVIGLPVAMHIALDQLIATLDKQPAKPEGSFEVTFWVVEAVAGAEGDLPRDLAEIGPLLEKLSGLGKRRFKSLDRVVARSRDGASTKLSGRMIDVEHKLASYPDGIELDLKLEVKGTWSDKPESGPTMETTLQVPLDRPIVIGDSAQAAASDGAANLLLYVVRAQRVD